MKVFYKLITGALCLCLFFTSCSKEESDAVVEPDTNMASLSFGTFVKDLNRQMKQTKDHLNDFPECSTAIPAYVIVELTGDGYDGPDELEIPLSDTPGDYDDDGIDEYFTLESDDLELPAGNYSLDGFTVYDDDDNLIWVAPTVDGSLGAYVDNALPTVITLSAGTKKYVDVEVLCYDKRMVNEYGYLFFELETNLALDFCFFANYCDENGRHFTAAYTIDIWYGVDDSGTMLYNGVGPEPSQYEESGEYYTNPVCFALPELPEGFDEDQPYVYFEATLADWDGNYGDVDPIMISGTLSYNDIIANFNGEEEVDYRHLRFGCGDNGGEVGCDINDPEEDCDNDGVLNGVDECVNVAGPASNNGCPEICDATDPEADCDGDQILNKCDTDASNYATFDCDGDGVLNGVDECVEEAGPVSNNGCPETCDATNPEADCDGDQILNKCDTDASNYATFDCDGDGVLNGVDECVEEAGPVSNNGCPETCEIGIADAGCSKYYLSGTTGFVQITQPTGEFPDPYGLIPEGGTFDDRIGSITVQLSENLDPVITVILNEGFSADDYIIEVRDESGSEISCVAQTSVSPPDGNAPDIFEEFTTTADFDYSFYVRIEVNACSTN